MIGTSPCPVEEPAPASKSPKRIEARRHVAMMSVQGLSHGRVFTNLDGLSRSYEPARARGPLRTSHARWTSAEPTPSRAEVTSRSVRRERVQPTRHSPRRLPRLIRSSWQRFSCLLRLTQAGHRAGCRYPLGGAWHRRPACTRPARLLRCGEHRLQRSMRRTWRKSAAAHLSGPRRPALMQGR